MKDFIKEIKEVIVAFIKIFKFIKIQKNNIVGLAGICLLIYQTFELKYIENLFKKSAPLFDIKVEYTHSLMPLAEQLVYKCGKNCFFGISFLKYDVSSEKYTGENLELFGFNKKNIVDSVLKEELYDSKREIKYGKCTSKMIDEIMKTSNNTSVIVIQNILKKCPEDIEELNKMFFYPQANTKNKHIACGNWKTIVNKITISVIKSSVGSKAYALIWLSQTNPITGNLQCTADYYNFTRTGCEKDDCEFDMKQIAKKSKEFTNEYNLR